MARHLPVPDLWKAHRDSEPESTSSTSEQEMDRRQWHGRPPSPEKWTAFREASKVTGPKLALKVAVPKCMYGKNTLICKHPSVNIYPRYVCIMYIYIYTQTALFRDIFEFTNPMDNPPCLTARTVWDQMHWPQTTWMLLHLVTDLPSGNSLLWRMGVQLFTLPIHNGYLVVS